MSVDFMVIVQIVIWIYVSFGPRDFVPNGFFPGVFIQLIIPPLCFRPHFKCQKLFAEFYIITFSPLRVILVHVVKTKRGADLACGKFNPINS